MADCKEVGWQGGSSGALAATGSMSGSRLLGTKKLDDFAKLFALFDSDLYIVDGYVAEQVNVSELPGDEAQIRKQTLTKI